MNALDSRSRGRTSATSASFIRHSDVQYRGNPISLYELPIREYASLDFAARYDGQAVAEFRVKCGPTTGTYTSTMDD